MLELVELRLVGMEELIVGISGADAEVVDVFEGVTRSAAMNGYGSSIVVRSVSQQFSLLLRP